VELLGDYIGSLTEEGLATLRDQRKRWEKNEKGEEDYDEDDEDDDGWTLVSRRKEPQCTRGRGGRGNRGRGNYRGFPGCRHSNGGRRDHI